MKSDKATASLFLDKRRAKKDGSFPVKLTIYYDCSKQRYGTGVSLTDGEWLKINETQLRDSQLKLVKRKLNLKLEKANTIIDGLRSSCSSLTHTYTYGMPYEQLSLCKYHNFVVSLLAPEKLDGADGGAAKVYQSQQTIKPRQY